MERIREKGLSPERVVKILAKHGTKVNVKEAGMILGFMEKLVAIAVNDLLRNGKAPTSYGAYKKLG